MATDTFRILAEVAVQVSNTEALQPLAKSIDAVTDKNKNLLAVQSALKAQIETTNDVAAKGVLTKALAETEKSLKANTEQAKKLSGELDDVGTKKAKKVGDELDNSVTKKVKKLGDEFGSAKKSADGFFDKILQFAGGDLLSSSIQRVIGSLSELPKRAAEFEALKKSLGFVTGGAVNAANTFEFFKTKSNELGFELESALVAFKGFAGATQSAFSTEQAQSYFVSFQKGFQAFGLSAEQTSGALLALQQIASKDKVSAEEFRLQLAERFPAATEIAARAIGKTTQEFIYLLDNGKLISTDFLPKFAAEFERTFGGVAANDGLAQNINRLKNELFLLSAELGEEALPLINELVKIIIGAIDVIKSAPENVEKFKVSIALLTTSLIALRAAFVTTAGVEAAGVAIGRGIAGIVASLNALKVAAATNPLFLLSSAILAIGSYLAYTTKAFQDFDGAVETNAAVLEAATKSAAKERAEIALTKQVIENETLTRQQRIAAIDKLQKQYPAYFGSLTKEQLLCGDVADAYGRLDSALISNARVRAAQNLLTQNEERRLQLEQELATLDKALQAKAGIGIFSGIELEAKRLLNVFRVEGVKKELDAINESQKALQAEAAKPIKATGVEQAKVTSTAFDANALKAAEKAKEDRIKLQQSTRKDLLNEISKLNDDIAKLNNKQGQETEQQIIEQNKIEADAYKRGLTEKLNELKKAKALTPELKKQFEQAFALVGEKFKIKSDIEIDDLRKKIAALKDEINAEIKRVSSETQIQSLKLKIDTASDNDIVGATEKLQNQVLLLQAENQAALLQNDKEFADRRKKVQDSTLLSQAEKETELTKISEIETAKRENILLQFDIDRENLNIAYFERIAQLQTETAERLVAITDEQIQSELTALDKRFLDGLVLAEDYEKQREKIQRAGAVSAVNAEILSTEKQLQIIRDQIAKVRELRETASLNVVEGIGDTAAITQADNEIARLNKELEELQKQLLGLQGKKVEAQVDVKINADPSAIQKAIEDPITAALSAIFPKIGEQATAQLKEVVVQAFSIGNEIAKEIQQEKLERIDAEISALEKSIEAQQKLKNVNTERVEQERLQIAKLQERKEQAARRNIVIQNLERISTLALAVAKAILAINETAAESGVAAPIIIPLVVAAIAIGTGVVLGLAGSAFDGDVDISKTGNRKPRDKRDTLLYAVSAGESIITRKGTERNKLLLERINKGETFNIVGDSFAATQSAIPNAPVPSYEKIQQLEQSVFSRATDALRLSVNVEIEKAMNPLLKLVKDGNERTNDLLVQIGILSRRHNELLIANKPKQKI